MSTNAKEQKYRPVLTMPQINLVVLALQSMNTHAEETKELLGYLEVFKVKQKVGLTTSAYATTPKRSMEEKLGLDDPATRRYNAYLKAEKYPELCTAQELDDAATYRYTNDLMNAQEEEEYESK